MSAETMERAYLELPSESLRIVADLVKKLGGRMYSTTTEDEKIYVEPPMPEYDRVASMLRGLRLRAGLKQKELAEMIGVPQSHISDYEKNKRRIPPQKSDKLAEVLETVASHFLYQD